MARIANLTIQKWGNSLAIRIPSVIARSAHLAAGQIVELIVQDSTLVIKPIGDANLTLAQKLALFDPAKHGGEAMATELTGVEVF